MRNGLSVWLWFVSLYILSSFLSSQVGPFPQARRRRRLETVGVGHYNEPVGRDPLGSTQKRVTTLINYLSIRSVRRHALLRLYSLSSAKMWPPIFRSCIPTYLPILYTTFSYLDFPSFSFLTWIQIHWIQICRLYKSWYLLSDEKMDWRAMTQHQ